MIRRVSRTRVSYVVQEDYSEYNTQHHAPVQALALDTSSINNAAGSRGGILYSGGRDGAVLAWDCNLGMDYSPPAPPTHPVSITSRQPSSSFVSRGHKHTFSASSSQLQVFRQGHTRGSSTGGPVSPNLIPGASAALGTVEATSPMVVGESGSSTDLLSSSSRTAAKPPQVQSPVTHRTFSISSAHPVHQPGIAVEMKRRRFNPEKTTHRTSYLGHSDWVNDVVLVDNNRGLVSGSSDRTLLLWPCHSPSYPNYDPSWTPTPSPIGAHSDYIKSLCYSSQQNWIASAGLDRRVCLWDLGEGRKDPLKSMWGVPLPQEAASAIFQDSPSHSVYSLATPPSGSILVSGSPEKVVRVWDPRATTQRRVTKLTGHTDNVRSVLVSDDGRWVLSASADATVKLWSLAQPARCVMTYTHFADSVWTLYSSHPDLETFWAGGKDGIVCKVNRNPPGRGLDSDVDEVGDVVVVCKEKGGVNKIVAVDDLYVFTAVANSSSINRWKDVPLRSPGSAYLASSGGASPVVATDSSGPAVPRATLVGPTASSSSSTAAPSSGLAPDIESLWEPVPIPALSILKPASTSLAFASFMPAMDGSSLRAGSSNRAFRSNSITGMVGVDSTMTEALAAEDARSAAMFDADSDSDDDTPAVPVFQEPEETIVGKVGIVNIFLCNDKRRVISEDADGVVTMWDITKCRKLRSWAPEPSMNSTGAAAAAGPSLYLSDDTGVKSKNPLFQQVVAQENTVEFAGTWCFLDNKTGAITVHLEENRCFDAEAYWDELVLPPIPEMREEMRVNIGKWVLAYLFQNFRHGCLYPNMPRPVQPRLTFSGSVDTFDDDRSEASGAIAFDSSSVASSGAILSEGVQMTRSATDISMSSNGIPASSASVSPVAIPASSVQQAVVLPGNKGALASSPSLMEGTSSSSDFQNTSPAPNATAVPQSPGGNSFMDRLKLHMRKRTTSNTDSKSDAKSPRGSVKAAGGSMLEGNSSPGSSANMEPQHPSDVNYRDAPPLELPPDVPVIVSVEESSEASSFLDLYRGTVYSMGNLDEIERLKQVIPTWVYEFTVEGKANVKEAQKMSFQLFAYPDSGLPELPSGNNRLSANRMLRIRKLLGYVTEKLELDPSNPRNAAARYLPPGVVASGGGAGALKPEVWLEMWVGDKQLTPKTTLATIRNYYWKTGGDVILHYRPIVRR